MSCREGESSDNYLEFHRLTSWYVDLVFLLKFVVDPVYPSTFNCLLNLYGHSLSSIEFCIDGLFNGLSGNREHLCSVS